jgi:WD40 repeat protein
MENIERSSHTSKYCRVCVLRVDFVETAKSSKHLLTPTKVLIEHDDSITSIAVPSQNDYVVSGSKDKSVILWNFHDGSVIFKLNGCTSEIVKVAISSDATVIFSCES